MRRWLVVAVIAVLAVALIGTTAMAQEVPEKPWAVKVGIFRPDSSAWRDVSRSTWLMLGVDYTAQVTPSGAEWLGSLEYAPGKNSNHLWSLQGIYKLRSRTDESQRTGFYYGAGVGAYFAKVRDKALNISKSQTRFGIPILAGIDFTKDFFGEVKYNLVFSKVLGERVNGFDVALGYRF